MVVRQPRLGKNRNALTADTGGASHASIFSTKGQVTIPQAARERLRLEAGTILDVKVDGNGLHLVPVPAEPKRHSLKIKKHKLTSWPMFVIPTSTPKVSQEWIDAQLADFP